uniref:Uncharacterized protein n=1 Tax=Meteorus pulchricornis TaxID=51522 RepID=H7CHK7_9HYME|nr:hypothetical protein [Meteorus pulchricornis]
MPLFSSNRLDTQKRKFTQSRKMKINIKTSVILLVLAIVSLETNASPIDEPISGSDSNTQELSARVKRDRSLIERQIMEFLESAGNNPSLALESGALQTLHELHKRSPKMHKTSLLTRLVSAGKKFMKGFMKGIAAS